VTYSLVGSTFDIRNTPLSLGDQTNNLVENPTTPVAGQTDDDFGPGRIVLRFEDENGSPKLDGKISVVEYYIDQHFQVAAAAEVETDLEQRVEAVCGAAVGTLTGGTATWENDTIYNVRSWGDLNCSGSCSLGGLNESNPRDELNNLPLNPFVFASATDISTFTMAEVQVPAGPQESVSDNFLSLTGRRISAELQAMEGFCEQGGGSLCPDLGGTTDPQESNDSTDTATDLGEVSACATWEETKQASANCTELSSSTDDDWFKMSIRDGVGLLGSWTQPDPQPRAEASGGDGTTVLTLCLYWQRAGTEDATGRECAVGEKQERLFDTQIAYGCCETGVNPTVELNPDADDSGTAWARLSTSAAEAMSYELSLGDASNAGNLFCSAE
ncbi:MAG: hypothetical protein MK135_04265, partial [Polyangiaceae bacterium]|nr:hypothetical protein [Polyangiaceae bacterium]